MCSFNFSVNFKENVRTGMSVDEDSASTQSFNRVFQNKIPFFSLLKTIQLFHLFFQKHWAIFLDCRSMPSTSFPLMLKYRCSQLKS